MEHLQPLIAQSLQLMLIGMGTVFIILTMLIFLIGMISKLIPQEMPEPLPRISRTAYESPPSGADKDRELVSVISAAITAYRHKHSPH
jgi:oxaloacetate decarboxylase gamma subunit